MFTPGIKASAIARMARIVVSALQKQGVELCVVRAEATQKMQEESIEFGVPTLSWTQKDDIESAIDLADAVVYHVGDNFPFHEGCLYWLERQRGIVCLHDFFLGDLFAAWMQNHHERGGAILKYWYGEEIAREWPQHLSSPDFIAATHLKAPLTEWVASQATAVIAHSACGMNRVLSACSGPVRVVPLAYEMPQAGDIPDSVFAQCSGKLQVLTVGHVNPNKRAESVIRALGSDRKLRESVVYTLVGMVNDDTRRRLEKLASDLGVQLRVCGEVSEAELLTLLSNADVVCCLRNPTLEAASASAIEAMLSARAVIVENHGFYSELPDDCVCKIRPNHEEEDLVRILHALSSDTEARNAQGVRASEWARQTFSGENYARQLMEILTLSQRSALVSEVMQGFAQKLESWGGGASMLCLPETLDKLRVFDVGQVELSLVTAVPDKTS